MTRPATPWAACEVLARLCGNPGYNDVCTEQVDQWVAAHKLQPSAALLKRASAAINRILGENSELCELWSEVDEGPKWRSAVEDLLRRLNA
jgi:hypothetical protein